MLGGGSGERDLAVTGIGKVYGKGVHGRALLVHERHHAAAVGAPAQVSSPSIATLGHVPVDGLTHLLAQLLGPVTLAVSLLFAILHVPVAQLATSIALKDQVMAGEQPLDPPIDG